MLSFSIFVISWGGQHEKAISIAKSVASASDKTSIVYSDANPDLVLDVECDQIKRPNELFWGDKLKACLDACDSDLMLVIHADCDCEDWAELARKCRSAMSNNPIIGVWAPHIDWTQYNLGRTKIYDIKSTPFAVVAQSDAIVFCLSKNVIERLRRANYEQNSYGWGTDALAIAYAYSNGMIAVVDKTIHVKHPKSRSYSTEAAYAQCREFFRQFTMAESIQDALLRSFMKVQDSRDTGENS